MHWDGFGGDVRNEKESVRENPGSYCYTNERDVDVIIQIWVCYHANSDAAIGPRLAQSEALHPKSNIVEGPAQVHIFHISFRRTEHMRRAPGFVSYNVQGMER